MTADLTIALAQLNPTVGDVTGNLALIRAARQKAAGVAEIVVTGELSVSGYPPEDLVLKPAFLDMIETKVNQLASETADGGPALLIGAPWRENGQLYNAVLLLQNGIIVTKRFKHLLPTYGVFDEDRVFSRGPIPGPIPFNGVRLGVMICEDMWREDVAEGLQESGAELFACHEQIAFRSGQTGPAHKPGRRSGSVNVICPTAYINLVGGQDELVFDGRSFVINRDRALKRSGKAWEPQLLITNWLNEGDGWACVDGDIAPDPVSDDTRLRGVYRAMVLGLRDYVDKNHFPGVIMGLSGGIDSGSIGCRCRGRHWGRQSALRHDAISIHLAGEPGRCCGSGGTSRHYL